MTRVLEPRLGDEAHPPTTPGGHSEQQLFYAELGITATPLPPTGSRRAPTCTPSSASWAPARHDHHTPFPPQPGAGSAGSPPADGSCSRFSTSTSFFTLPHAPNPLAPSHPRWIYRRLFRPPPPPLSIDLDRLPGASVQPAIGPPRETASAGTKTRPQLGVAPLLHSSRNTEGTHDAGQAATSGSRERSSGTTHPSSASPSPRAK
jgi:hypothetical protein